MKRSKSMCVSTSDVKKIINRLIDSFKSDEPLSVFELGQIDGLRWVIDCLEQIETPEEN
jgi:hypothetical protein